MLRCYCDRMTNPGGADAETSQPAPAATPRRDTPPATLRLNDEASTTLWRAYLTEKARDPFMSLRQYASKVVLAGLANR